jgi:hypothetical protein
MSTRGSSNRARAISRTAPICEKPRLVPRVGVVMIAGIMVTYAELRGHEDNATTSATLAAELTRPSV